MQRGESPYPNGQGPTDLRDASGTVQNTSSTSTTTTTSAPGAVTSLAATQPAGTTNALVTWSEPTGDEPVDSYTAAGPNNTSQSVEPYDLDVLTVTVDTRALV